MFLLFIEVIFFLFSVNWSCY